MGIISQHRLQVSSSFPLAAKDPLIEASILICPLTLPLEQELGKPQVEFTVNTREGHCHGFVVKRRRTCYRYPSRKEVEVVRFSC